LVLAVHIWYVAVNKVFTLLLLGGLSMKNLFKVTLAGSLLAFVAAPASAASINNGLGSVTEAVSVAAAPTETVVRKSTFSAKSLTETSIQTTIQSVVTKTKNSSKSTSSSDLGTTIVKNTANLRIESKKVVETIKTLVDTTVKTKVVVTKVEKWEKSTKKYSKYEFNLHGDLTLKDILIYPDDSESDFNFDYKEKFVEIVYSNLMSTSLGLETDISNSKNHALLGKQFLEEDEDNFNFGAIANQLNNILSKANAPKQIDFLSLDVEGAEIEVLKGINHNEYRFKFICIESRDIQKINNYLTINNYLLIEQFSPIDYLFKDKELKL
jgi:hypothetical protein